MVGSVFIILGSLVGVAGAVGLLRFPNFHTRIHAAGVTDSLCSILVLGGLMFLSDSFLLVTKLLMVLFFLLFTTPTASYVLVRTSLKSGCRPSTDVKAGSD